MKTDGVVPMESKLLAVFSAGLKSVNVSQLCGELGVSRETFYKYRRRYASEGVVGLAERSRRPHTSPGMLPADLEDEIVRLRKVLEPDNGAQTIAYYLQRDGRWPVPAVSTIHRALVRRGMVVPQPQKRPRSAVKRFEWPRPNDLWQIDATLWMLADRRDVWIMDILDDHSRLLPALNVCDGPTGPAAWDAFCDGTEEFGLPAHMLSDNGRCFTGRFLASSDDAPSTVAFERDLASLGIKHILSSPGHPQTCGKLERFHQTLKRWLALQPLAETPEQLQEQLDRFRIFYNMQRPHRALKGQTPIERWRAQPPATPGEPISLRVPPAAVLRLVSVNGRVNWKHKQIYVGADHAAQHLLVVARGDDISIFGPGGLIRRVTLDGRTSYPRGVPGGRPKKLKPC